jgi:hypothetical protein
MRLICKYNVSGIKINFYRLVANWATRKTKVVAQTKVNSCYSSTLTMLSLHDIFDKIKTKFQELECKWTGQMEEYSKKNILPGKKVVAQTKSY